MQKITIVVEHIIFLGDTTNPTSWAVRVAKLFSGDIDNDDKGDIVFTNTSLSALNPHIYFM